MPDVGGPFPPLSIAHSLLPTSRHAFRYSGLNPDNRVPTSKTPPASLSPPPIAFTTQSPSSDLGPSSMFRFRFFESFVYRLSRCRSLDVMVGSRLIGIVGTYCVGHVVSPCVLSLMIHVLANDSGVIISFIPCPSDDCTTNLMSPSICSRPYVIPASRSSMLTVSGAIIGLHVMSFVTVQANVQEVIISFAFHAQSPRSYLILPSQSNVHTSVRKVRQVSSPTHPSPSSSTISSIIAHVLHCSPTRLVQLLAVLRWMAL